MAAVDYKDADNVEIKQYPQFALEDELVDIIKEGIGEENFPTLQEIAGELHHADLADLLNNLDEEPRHTFIDAITAKEGLLDAEAITGLRESVRDDLLSYLSTEDSAEAISRLETDDAVEIIESLDEKDQQEILQAIPEVYRREVTEGLSYPEDSAGRMMRKNFVAVPEYWTVGNVIDFLRHENNAPEYFYQIFVIDPNYHPIGGVLLSCLLQHKRSKKLSDLLTRDLKQINTTMDQEEVARIFRKYGLTEAVVVNDKERIVGTITVDDVVHVIEEEAEEDIMRLGGLLDADIYTKLTKTIGRRFPWLFFNLLTAIAASVVIGVFSGTIEQLVALAVLMPIVASMGGNAGTQTVTVAVRALATQELNQSNYLKLISKELLVGSANGLLFAIVAASPILLWYGSMELAFIFGLSTVITLMMAGGGGAIIPIMLNRFNIDPAIASGIFLTTITDITGFGSFLWLAHSWMV
jgi:magnesium transporter